MTVDYRVDDGVAIVTLNRPDVLNAFDDELGNKTLEAVRRAASDDSVRCIVITGAGRAFSSGEDLGALADSYSRGEPADLGQTLIDRYNPLIRAIRSVPKPVVAAVNGAAAGAGAGIALACDFRILSEKAKLILAFVKVGLVPDSGSLWFLTQMIGAARAWELAATGAPVDAAEALRLGLANRVVPADEFEHEWLTFAKELVAAPTRALGLIKELTQRATYRSLDEQLDDEVEAQTEAGKTSDHVEGVRAFIDKRAPKFEGR